MTIWKQPADIAARDAERYSAPMKNHLPLSLIAACAHDRVIGLDNRMPWHLPADLKHFKQTTLGKPIIMGRKTWDSLGRPLPGRLNLVISRQAGLQLEGAEVFASLAAAIARADQWAREQGVDEIMLIGGGQLYAEALPLAARIYLTRIDLTVAGDAFFPEFTGWQLVESEAHAAGETTPAFRFETWVPSTSD